MPRCHTAHGVLILCQLSRSGVMVTTRARTRAAARACTCTYGLDCVKHICRHVACRLTITIGDTFCTYPSLHWGVPCPQSPTRTALRRILFVLACISFLARNRRLRDDRETTFRDWQDTSGISCHGNICGSFRVDGSNLLTIFVVTPNGEKESDQTSDGAHGCEDDGRWREDRRRGRGRGRRGGRGGSRAVARSGAVAS